MSISFGLNLRAWALPLFIVNDCWRDIEECGSELYLDFTIYLGPFHMCVDTYNVDYEGE